VASGKNVDLIPVERGHLQHFARWLNDPEVTRFLNWYLPINADGEEKWFNNLSGNQGAVHFTIAAKVSRVPDGRGQTSIPIGNCTIRIDWKNRVGNIGIMIGEKEHWGKGLGTEALQLLVDYGFGTMDMHRLELETFDFNERAYKSYTKVGFQEEGRRRQAHYIDGKRNDVVFMGLLQDDWRARQARAKS
jgi:RimJ/RimL family protein N-acetyltransferase